MTAAAARPRAGRRRTGRDSGQVLVVFALTITVLFVAAGLAFDVGRFYGEKRFLQNAADAAALAAANALVRGETATQADARARESLALNFAHSPSGIVPAPPPTTPVYATGHAGDPEYLINGILINGGEVRVAVQNPVSYTFGRIVGLNENTIGGQARAKSRMDLLPIAVRRYVNAPGPNASAASPCSLQSHDFADYLATAETACLGTETNAALRTAASAGMAFDSTNANNDPSHHGPIVEILGQGAQPSNGADFRGFVSLDVRNYENSVSREYYNGATFGQSESSLANQEAAWMIAGYPGPDFPVSTMPVDFGSQVGTFSGNDTGVAIDSFDDRYDEGDNIMVLVYSGAVAAIPDFTINPPSQISIGSSETLSVAGTYAVSKNNSFSGTVDMSTEPDTGNPADLITTGAITSSPPITHDPTPVTPSMGGGTTVTMRNLTTSGATPGIYPLWLHGHSASPYLRDHYEPMYVNVGGVTRTFTMTTNTKNATAATIGGTVSWTVDLSSPAGGSQNFNGDVTLSLENLPAGLGSITWSGTTTVNLGPGPNANQTRTLTVNTGTTSPGDYPLHLRATGTNSAGQVVTRLLELGLQVAVSPPSENYIDILGFAVFRVSNIGTNTLWGYAITGMATDPDDPQLLRGQVARLVPWN
jgi:hypothetical protein